MPGKNYLTKKALQHKCTEEGLSTSGNREDMLKRLNSQNKLIFDLMHSIHMFHMSRSSSDGEALNSNCVATPKPVGE